jgi:hypothetical protein
MIRSILIDDDDINQIMAIAKWQGKYGKTAIIDALRHETHYRKEYKTPPLKFVYLNGRDYAAASQPPDVVDRIVLERALSRLDSSSRQLVEATILGEQSLRSWAKEHNMDWNAADRRRKSVINRLKAMPEIQSLQGVDCGR